MSETIKIIASSIAKLRALLLDSKHDLARIQTLLTALVTTLDKFWDDVDLIAGQQTLWKETISILASGRALSVAAQAEEALRFTTTRSKSWVSDGKEYARWLGHGVVRLSENEHSKLAAQLCAKAFNLGHSYVVVEVILDKLALEVLESSGRLQVLVASLSAADCKRFFIAMINLLSTRYLIDKDMLSFTERNKQQAISNVAALLRIFTSSTNGNADLVCEWMTSQPCSNSVARAALAALPSSAIYRVLRTCWAQFGDELRTKHTSIIHQESTAQLLLMAAGYVYRSDPAEVLSQARSSVHASGISSHLASSSPRIRFLGMMVGMAISQLVDQPENVLKFSGQEFDTNEAKWYMNLAHVQDTVGSLAGLQPLSQFQEVKKLAPKPVPAPTAKKMIVEVIDDEEEDEDLAQYQRPDSDREDEDEDPTLVQRNKPKAPVYIRDLVSGLQDTENYDRYSLALSSAGPLIRRKADFGAEVKDNAEELASVLTSLSDPFDIGKWHEMRQDAMVAIGIADPKRMGIWYSKAFFTGDYSLSQRASILVTLGLSARELAGLQSENEAKPMFPSKRLPDRLNSLYAETAEVDILARRLEHSMLQPVATARRRKVIKNQLAAIVAESFFFPLTGYWQSLSQSRQARKVFQDPFLLPLFLKTLAIIISAAGPSTISLPQMTSEFWNLLFSLRSQAVTDAAIMEAELFGFLSLLNVNEDRRQLALDNSNEIIETREWVGTVYEKLSTVDEESERCKVLAAGVLVAVNEVVDKYQRLMAGNLAVV